MRDRDYFALITLILGLAVGIVIGAFATRGDTCVPHHAVRYSGQLHAWLDPSGAVVILANEEDSVPFCNSYKEQP